jgi:hypothetical protein
LVGYDSTNVFRIWIPHRGEVISSLDAIFDEDEFFDGKKVDLDDGLVATLDNFVHQIRLPMQALRNEVILQEDDEIHHSFSVAVPLGRYHNNLLPRNLNLVVLDASLPY